MSDVICTKVRLFNAIFCAPKDITDEELVKRANEIEPCGTTNGWSHVHRCDEKRPEANPVQCADDPNKMHFVISC